MKDNHAVVDNPVAVGVVAGWEVVGGAQRRIIVPDLDELLIDGEKALADEVFGVGVPA